VVFFFYCTDRLLLQSSYNDEEQDGTL